MTLVRFYCASAQHSCCHCCVCCALQVIGMPHEAVKKRDAPRPKRPCWDGCGRGWRPPQLESGARESPPEKNWNFKCKFLLSVAHSARKLTPAKVQNTTHFHSRLWLYTCIQHGVTLKRGPEYGTSGQLFVRSWDFIQTILLKALFIAKSSDLICALLSGQDSRPWDKTLFAQLFDAVLLLRMHERSVGGSQVSFIVSAVLTGFMSTSDRNRDARTKLRSRVIALALSCSAWLINAASRLFSLQQ